MKNRERLSLSQNLLDLTNLALNFPGYFLGFALGLQFGIVGDLSGDFLDFPFRFMQRAFRLVPDARLHDFLLLRVMVDFSLRNGWDSANTNFAGRMPLFMFDK